MPKPFTERRAIAEHFCGALTLSLLIKLEKLIQISNLIKIGTVLPLNFLNDPGM